MLMKRKSIQAPDPAEHLALDVLDWLIADEERLGSFLNASGIDQSNLRQSLRAPGFLGAVLDHVMGDEAMLLACADSLGIRPERIAEAWRRTAPPEPDDPF